MNVPVALALVMGEKWLAKYDTAKQLGKLQVLDARRIAYADHADVNWCKFHQPLEDRVTSGFGLFCRFPLCSTRGPSTLVTNYALVPWGSRPSSHVNNSPAPIYVGEED